MMCIKTKNSLLVISLLFTVNVTFSQSLKKMIIRPGNYDDVVTLSYDSTSHEISGFLSAKELDNSGQKVKYNCSLFFRGYFNNSNKMPVDYFKVNDFVKISSGFILLKSDEILLKSDVIIPFCQTIFDLNNANGYSFSFSSYKHYRFCRPIKTDKAFIYKYPNNVKTKMYLIKGDIVPILNIQGNWVHIEFKAKKQISGWVRKEDIETFHSSL